MIGAYTKEQSLQRLTVQRSNWAFYLSTLESLSDRRRFITYYRGELEVAEVSFQHYRTSRLFLGLIAATTQVAGLPLVSAGSTTLRREILDAGLEPDGAFYIANAARVQSKRELDMNVDPPPDLALEVEVTRRLGQRTDIYRQLNVPEVWRYSVSGLQILVRRGDEYVSVDSSPTLPWLSPVEVNGFIELGLTIDETAWARKLRERIRESIAARP